MSENKQKFRIITQDVDPNQENSLASGGCGDFNTGHECEGFVIMAKDGDGISVFMHHVNIDDLGDMIEKSDKLMAGAILAKAKREAKQFTMSYRMKEIFSPVNE